MVNCIQYLPRSTLCTAGSFCERIFTTIHIVLSVFLCKKIGIMRIHNKIFILQNFLFIQYPLAGILQRVLHYNLVIIHDLLHR